MAKRATPGLEFATHGSRRGMKLHLHEAAASGPSGSLTVWAFHIIFDQEFSESHAKMLLGNMVTWSKAHRTSPLWQAGGHLAAQLTSEGDLERLLQRANTASTLPEAEMQQLASKVDDVQQLMKDNIELMLERQEQLELMGRKADELSAASKFLFKRARSAKRFQMWQEAKWGVALGTAATVGAAIIAIPILL